MSKPSDKSKTGKTVQHKTADYDSVFSGVVELLDAVSYTHLDVYKRQRHKCGDEGHEE